MKARWIGGVAVLMMWLAGVPLPAQGRSTQCHLTFSLEGWSFFYKTATGTGTITCDDGESARVSITSRGGGVTFGRSTVIDGRGAFSEVSSIDDLFGSYGAADAHAGIGPSSYAQVVTKGTVSLTLSGTGSGIDVGVGFGNFVLERQSR